MLADMSEQEIMAFLFLPGFTTKENVSKLSGRGVGLDIVHSMLQEVGGTIEVESKAGERRVVYSKASHNKVGDEISWSVYRRSALRVFAEQSFGNGSCAPRGNIAGRRREVLYVFKQAGRLVDAARALGFQDSRSEPDFSYVVIVCQAQEYFGFKVDNMPFEVDLVVRPLHPLLGRVQCVSSTSIADDGTPILILDIDDLILSAKKVLKSSGDIEAADGTAGKSASKRILDCGRFCNCARNAAKNPPAGGFCG